ncbi:hypothetical protein J7J81_01260 [bacterium]|nr:hypothetical protein [bacterium]
MIESAARKALLEKEMARKIILENLDKEAQFRKYVILGMILVFAVLKIILKPIPVAF